MKPWTFEGAWSFGPKTSHRAKFWGWLSWFRFAESDSRRNFRNQRVHAWVSSYPWHKSQKLWNWLRKVSRTPWLHGFNPKISNWCAGFRSTRQIAKGLWWRRCGPAPANYWGWDPSGKLVSVSLVLAHHHDSFVFQLIRPLVCPQTFQVPMIDSSGWWFTWGIQKSKKVG